ncbi:hypothetical protein TIFTF001_030606 [Ficus carica]|uniref:Uncharacterized protein n=1 Tax=Ficus carica TaxID=3494 RepID=A0AA88DTZ4_FICCA|nr:hypothetical protein TIFTF001_030606 [Ficus carica]
MPSPSIPPPSSSVIPSSAPNFSNNIGRLPGGLQRPSGVVPPIPHNRRDCFARSLRRKILGLKGSTTNVVERTRARRTNLEIITQHEQNGRIGQFPDNVCSPYYRGLLGNSPQPFFTERAESHAASTTDYSKASRTSSFMVKFQAGFASCLLFRSKKRDDNRDNDYDDDDEPPKATRLKNTSANVTSTAAPAPPYSSFLLLSSPPLPASEVSKKELALGKEIATTSVEKERSNSYQKKPLRESITTSGPAEAVPLPDQPPISPLNEVHHVDQKDINIIYQQRKPLDGEREFLWADKYRPKFLEDFICNKSNANQLLAMARKGDCGHFIFQGPPGVGKRTMIWAMLREAFGPDSVKASEEYKVINVKGEVVRSVQVLVKVSPRLVEVNLSDLKGYEKHVIFELIKETSDLKISNKSDSPCKPPDNCRVIIFYGIDKLSTDAILYVKWLLERYKVCNNIFFCCVDISKLQAIKDLCTLVQLLPPSREEIIEVLKFIAHKEGIELPLQLAEKITDTSKNNLRQAIRSFEATWLKQLYDIRGKLQDLIDHEVSPEFIFQSLVDELQKHLHNLLKRRVHNLYAEYNRKEWMTSVKRERERAWVQEDDNRQKRREKTIGTWVQGRQSSEEEGEDYRHLGA